VAHALCNWNRKRRQCGVSKGTNMERRIQFNTNTHPFFNIMLQLFVVFNFLQIDGAGARKRKLHAARNKLLGAQTGNNGANLALRAETMNVIANETFGGQFAFENFDSSSPQRPSMSCTTSTHICASSPQ
jgi:hypothetical protein